MTVIVTPRTLHKMCNILAVKGLNMELTVTWLV